MTAEPITRNRFTLSPWQLAIAAVLRDLRVGGITIEMPNSSVFEFKGSSPGPEARIIVNDTAIARRVAVGGSLGLAQGYVDGAWDTPDLGAVLDLGLENIELGWTAGLPSVLAPLQRLRHFLRDNDLDGSRKNIAEHYDLGNDFYSLWLDDTLTYSSACLAGDETFPLNDGDLACAQRRKWDRVLDLIQPRKGMRLLEIGCGWGGFAIHAAREAGCRVTALTLSKEQAELARARVRDHGLEDRIEVLLQDYRTIDGRYDAIASIEMFEAVGERWWPTFFGRLKQLLEPMGVAALQTITIAEQRYEGYRRSPDFIQRYIFPGGMLPSPERFVEAAKDAGLTVAAPRFFGQDYAHTLAAWAARFERALGDVRELGFDERFIRMWRYYLQYCRTGFEHGTIDVMQVRIDA